MSNEAAEEATILQQDGLSLLFLMSVFACQSFY